MNIFLSLLWLLSILQSCKNANKSLLTSCQKTAGYAKNSENCQFMISIKCIKLSQIYYFCSRKYILILLLLLLLLLLIIIIIIIIVIINIVDVYFMFLLGKIKIL